MFSSLVGVQFMVPRGRGDGLVHVNITDFNDVQIKLLGQSSSIAKLDKSGSFVDYSYVAKATAIDYDVISTNVQEPSSDHVKADRIFVASISPPPWREHILIRAVFSDVGGFTIENGNITMNVEVIKQSNTTLMITLRANAHIEVNWDPLDRKHLTARHVLFGLPATMKYNLNADVDCSVGDPLVLSILLRVEEKGDAVVPLGDILFIFTAIVVFGFIALFICIMIVIDPLSVNRDPPRYLYQDPPPFVCRDPSPSVYPDPPRRVDRGRSPPWRH